MAVSRRGFVTACLGLISVPFLQKPVSQGTATRYLTEEYNRRMKGKGSAFAPKHIEVSPELYEQFVSEQPATMQFGKFKELRFKGPTLRANPLLTGRYVLWFT